MWFLAIVVGFIVGWGAMWVIHRNKWYVAILLALPTVLIGELFEYYLLYIGVVLLSAFVYSLFGVNDERQNEKC